MQNTMTTMMRLRHDDGSVTAMPDDIGKLATRYYREMFTPEPCKDPHEQERDIESSRATTIGDGWAAQ